MTCPLCGAPTAYAGLNGVECPTKDCPNWDRVSSPGPAPKRQSEGSCWWPECPNEACVPGGPCWQHMP